MASSTRAGSAARRAESAGAEGYTFLALVGLITVMLIAIGAALPHWRAVVQRDKEAELIARGFQYAEAIRVFQLKQGRLPNQLAELLELEPRSIRRLWDDPMTGGPFLVLMEGPEGTVVPVDPETGEIVAPPPVVDPDAPGEEGEPSGRQPTTLAQGTAPRGSATAAVAGPIHGVKSRASGEAYRTLFDQKDFGMWEFTVERLAAAIQATDPYGLPRRLDYSTIGKPFRYPPPGGIAGANPQAQPGGRPSRPRRPGDPPPGPVPQPPPGTSGDEQ